MTRKLVLMVLLSAGCAVAQDAPAPQEPPATQPPPVTEAPGSPAQQADPKIDEVLDALDRRGQQLDSFRADVALSERDAGLGGRTISRGSVIYQRQGEDDARIRVDFSERVEEDQRSAEKRVYVLEDGVLTERDYPMRKQITRQVLRPGEKMNLLRLGEGPFPLPIGQDKQEVHRMFEVSLIAPARNDPENTVHIRLVPRPGTRFEQQFKRIDVWVDQQNDMPRRISTLDANEVMLRTTDLTNVQVNIRARDDDFRLDRIDPRKWTIVDEPYQ
jgi:hypothetical protein